MAVIIKGAGDLASGVCCRLSHAGFSVVMTDLAVPTTVRRTVAFSRAVYQECVTVEDITGVLCHDITQINTALKNGQVAVVVDEHCAILPLLCPDALVDAIMAKRNTGTKLSDAPCVIGLGPGFTASVDCHAAVETKRGHSLGRVLYTGSPLLNTGVPGEIGGVGAARLLRAVTSGSFEPICQIGDMVLKGQLVARSGGGEIYAGTDGVVRGMLQEGVFVTAGMKCGDVDPRGNPQHCLSVSDKALSLGGGVLEALLHFGCRRNNNA